MLKDVFIISYYVIWGCYSVNTFFFDFQLYIDFKIWPLKLADVEPCASLIYWFMTGKRKCIFLLQQVVVTQKRKNSHRSVHQLFRLVNAFLTSCQIIFDFLNLSIKRVEEDLKVRYFMRSMFLMTTLLDKAILLNE